MKEVIDDEMLDAFVPSGTYEAIAAELERRYAGLAGAITLVLPDDPAEDAAFAGVVAALRGA